MSDKKLLFAATAAFAALGMVTFAQGALRNVSSWYAMQSNLPSSYSSYDARAIVGHVQERCERSEGGFSDAGSGMTSPSVRVDRTCRYGGSSTGELYVPNGDTIRFNIGC